MDSEAPEMSARQDGLSSVVFDGLERLPTGIAIFGSDLRLCYSNPAFRKLRDLPEASARSGTHLRDIVHWIVQRGDYGKGIPEAQVESRLSEIAQREVWEVEQEVAGARRLCIRHTHLRHGRLMITYTDVTEVRAAERQVRENEERYGLVTQAVAEGIYDWSIEENTLFVSARLMDMFGFESGGLTSRDWFNVVHKTDRESYRRALRDCFKGTTRRVDCEYRILLRTGEYRWMEDHGLPVRNEVGRVIRLVGAVSDVTVRKEIEDALRESQERHEVALQSVNESIYEWDIATGAIYYSPRLYATLGLTPEELGTVEDWVRRIHPEDLPNYRAAMRNHFKGLTERLEVEYRYRHSDDSWHWARQHGLAQRDERRRAIRLTGSTGDITTEKRATEELERTRRRLQDAIETIAEGFVLFDPQDRIVLSNRRYRDFFASVQEEVWPGNSFEKLIRAAVARGLFPAAQSDPNIWIASQLERRRTRSGARETQLASGIRLRVSDYPMSDGSLVSVYTDVTDVRQRQDELERAKAAAEAALEQLKGAQQQLVETQKLAALGQLTAGVAHEIKNPLNFINNFADLSSELLEELQQVLTAPHADALAEANELANTIKGNLTKVVEHGRRADSIVKNMLLHSRDGSGERSAVELNTIAEESLNLAYHGARAENASFNVRLSTALDPNVGSVDAYPQELVRVFLNLISNAFHAVHKRQRDGGDASFEPEVTVSTSALANAVEIRVRDNGTGIPDEVRAKMFDPFFTTKPPGEGTGLGLSLSHDIVTKQHGGRINVDSRVGEFTEFVITLPRGGSAREADERSAP